MTRYCRLALSVAVVATLGLLGTVRPNGAMPPLLAQGASAQRRPLLTLQPGDHICTIGNQLAERMQYQGWLDTLLYARFPQHDLVMRNLGFSGDEIAERFGRETNNVGASDGAFGELHR